MEYFISTDLSNVGAVFNLHSGQYSLIEIDNDVNVTQVVFTVSHSVEITGSIEVSGNALNYIFFQAPNQSIALYKCSIKGANEIKVISNSLTIESVETLALSANSQDIEINRLDVKNALKIEGSTTARLSKILSGDLSIETKDLKTSDSITSTGSIDIVSSSSELSGSIVSLSNVKINSATSCKVSGDILSSKIFAFQGSPLEISGSSASIKAPSINIESESCILKDGAKFVSADANLGIDKWRAARFWCSIWKR